MHCNANGKDNDYDMYRRVCSMRSEYNYAGQFFYRHDGLGTVRGSFLWPKYEGDWSRFLSRWGLRTEVSSTEVKDQEGQYVQPRRIQPAARDYAELVMIVYVPLRE